MEMARVQQYLYLNGEVRRDNVVRIRILGLEGEDNGKID
jgi:hypothetical protein